MFFKKMWFFCETRKHLRKIFSQMRKKVCFFFDNFYTDTMFVDEVTVKLKAGNGGHGCLSFRREKYIPKGGPDGGDGGEGGNVLLVCDRNVGDLIDYKFKPHAQAQSGESGMGSRCHGKNGEHCLLKVPPGTVVYDDQAHHCIGELMRDGDQLLLLKGGRGGLGNVHFKSSTNQAPRTTIPGTLGEEGTFRFEMKSIAHVGLVGFPNAGKSTLTNLLTATKRRTGSYAFTTLHPKVGIMQGNEQITIADIPGIIKGAHQNRGLGFRFLRHIERCSTLAFMIDISASESRHPLDDYAILRDELGHYDADLLHKKCIIIANKMDLPSAAEHLDELRKKLSSLSIFPISCQTGEGISTLRNTLEKIVFAAG
jgi:GTP-binding protein